MAGTATRRTLSGGLWFRTSRNLITGQRPWPCGPRHLTANIRNTTSNLYREITITITITIITNLSERYQRRQLWTKPLGEKRVNKKRRENAGPREIRGCRGSHPILWHKSLEDEGGPECSGTIRRGPRVESEHGDPGMASDICHAGTNREPRMARHWRLPLRDELRSPAGRATPPATPRQIECFGWQGEATCHTGTNGGPQADKATSALNRPHIALAARVTNSLSQSGANWCLGR